MSRRIRTCLLVACMVYAQPWACQTTLDSHVARKAVKTPPLASTCTIRIDEPRLDAPKKPSTVEWPQSEVVVRISFDTSALTTRLSREVPARVAADQNVDAGVAGKLKYRIDRSPFAISVREGRLLVSTYLTSHAELCKPLGPLGCVAYAHCAPAANAVAAIPLSLGANYRPGPAQVRIRVVRPCQIGAIDATDRIQRGAHVQARRLQQYINRFLPSFASDAQLLWQAMGIHVPLGLDIRLRLQPEHVVEGDPSQDGSIISIPLGVRGKVVIENRKGEREEVGEIPPPRREHDLSAGLRINVPIGVDRNTIDADLSRSVRESAASVFNHRILSVRTQSDGERLRLFVSISGSACGVVAFSAIPTYHESSNRVRLRDVEPIETESARMVNVGAQVDLERIAVILASRASIQLPVDPFAIPRGLERAVEMFADDERADVVVNVQHVSIDGVFVQEDSLFALARIRGTAGVVIR